MVFDSIYTNIPFLNSSIYWGRWFVDGHLSVTLVLFNFLYILFYALYFAFRHLHDYNKGSWTSQSPMCMCVHMYCIISYNIYQCTGERPYRPTSVEITSNSRWNLSGQPSYKGKYTYTYVNRYLHPTEGNFMDAAESKVRVRKREHCVFESRTNLYSGASHSLTESENFRNASVVSVVGLR